MATVTKDFKVKNGIKVQGDANIDASLYVAGPNATVNGSEIITEDIITGGTQTNIAVTYNPSTKTLDFVAENGVADSTTNDLVEGENNLYFTDERAQDAVGNSVGSGLTYDQSSNILAVKLWPGNAITADVDNNLIVRTDGSSVVINQDGKLAVDTGTGSPVAAKTYVEDSINALTTSDIEEGTNLYFTAQRAIDAVGGSASSENIPGTVVKRDSNGSFATEDITAADITADSYTFTGGSASITNGSLGMAIFAAQGDITFGAQTGEVQIGGAQVTTESNTQTLTNKTIGDELVFNDGGQNSLIDVNGNNLTVSAFGDLDLWSSTGNIVLRPDMLTEIGKVYIGSSGAGNEVATHSYVDNAVSGLTWKEAVNLLATTNVDQSLGNSAFPIDGHAFPGEPYRILLTAQTDPTQNGIWVYEGVNETWSRPADADTVTELVGAAVFVMEGTQYNATSWVQNNHYADTFDDLTWTQFSGTGNYTAGFGINLVGREFSADTTEMATSEALNDAIANVTDIVDGYLNSNDGTVIAYINDQDDATLLAANNFSTNLVATGDAAATPQYLAINVNDVARQVAATSSAFATLPSVAYAFPKADFRSAKFLVKLAYGTHTEVSEVLLTLDTSDNVAITEYAIVGTNGSLSTISAEVDGPVVNLLVTPVNDSAITVVGTLLV